MGTEKMSRLIITTGAPLMLSLLINSLYNFVDSVFVSRISEAVLPVLFALVLRRFGSVTLIWWAFVLGEGAGVPLAAALWRKARSGIG